MKVTELYIERIITTLKTLPVVIFPCVRTQRKSGWLVDFVSGRILLVCKAENAQAQRSPAGKGRGCGPRWNEWRTVPGVQLSDLEFYFKLNKFSKISKRAAANLWQPEAAT